MVDGALHRRTGNLSIVTGRQGLQGGRGARAPKFGSEHRSVGFCDGMHAIFGRLSMSVETKEKLFAYVFSVV